MIHPFLLASPSSFVDWWADADTQTGRVTPMQRVWRLHSRRGVLHLILSVNILSVSCLHQLSVYQGLLWHLGVLPESIWAEIEPKQQNLPCCPQAKSTAVFALTTAAFAMGESLLLAGCWPFPTLRFYQLMGAQGLLDKTSLLQLRKECSDGLSWDMEAHRLRLSSPAKTPFGHHPQARWCDWI